MAPEISKKGWAILSVCVGGKGPPKRPLKSKVFGSVFRYLKVDVLLDYYEILIRLFLDSY